MKRFLASLLVIFVLISLNACSLLPQETPASSLAENVAPENQTEGTESTEDTTVQEKPAEPDAPADETESGLAEPDEPGEEAQTPESEYPVDPEPEKPAEPEPEKPAEPEPEKPAEPEPEKPAEPEPPHQHRYDSAITKPATCTDKGIKTFTCACGDSYTEDVSPTGHDWGSWKTVKDPTVSAEGVSQRQCKNCEKTESKPIDKLSGKVTVTFAQLQAIENQFLMLVNLERQRVGVGALSINSYLEGWAQIRSQEIVISFSHTRPSGEAYYSVVDPSQYPYSMVGENLAMTSHVGDGYYYPDQDRWVGSDAQIEQAAAWIFTLLKNSPGHYANMIKGDYQHCGIGISYVLKDSEVPYFYVAHIFGAQYQ